MSKTSSRVTTYITVEPAFLLFTVTFVIVEITYTNLLLQKRCRFNATTEPDLSTKCEDEKLGILYASEMNTSFRATMFFLCSIISIFALRWSDIAGRCRRPLVLLPIIGLFLQCVNGCVHSYFWSWNPFNAALWNTIFDVISGGIPLLTFATQTYLCDVSNNEDRTMRLGLYSAVRTVGDLSGFGSGGFILRGIGFFYTFLLCSGLSIVTFILALVFVKDISVPVSESKCSVFNIFRICDGFKVVFNKNLGNNRIVVLMLVMILPLMFVITQGESSVQYLFLRHKFGWNESDYSLYVIYRYCGVIIGSIFCSIVLSKCLKIHDGLIGVFAGCWDIVAAFGYLFATENWHLFVVPLFDIFHGTTLSVCVSFFSKYYKSEELGRLSSVIAVFSLLVTLGVIIYNLVFQKTIDYFPSAYFLLSIVSGGVVVLLYGYSFYLSKKYDKKTITKEETSMMHNAQ